MVASILFIVAIGAMIAFSIRISGSAINVFVILAAPYFILVPLNQFVAAPFYGFYTLSDATIVMLGSALIAFFIGYVLITAIVPVFKKRQAGALEGEAAPSIQERFGNYNMSAMAWLVFVFAAVFLLRMVVFIAMGHFDIKKFDDSTDVFSQGIVAHLNIMVSAITPLLALHALEKRDKLSIGAVIIAFVCSFATFHKYNVLGLLVVTVLFLMLNRKKHKWVGVVVLVVLAVLFFVANYLISFVVRDINQGTAFYVRHFLEYTVGSIVYDNYIFSAGIGADGSLVAKILTVVFAFPNMFLSPLFGISMFSYEIQVRKIISTYGDSTNLNDAIGFFYPLSGNMAEIVGFAVLFIIAGMLFSVIYTYLIKRNAQKFSLTLPVILTYFLFFSFFGTFYVLSSFWELLIWSAVLPWVFCKNRFRYLPGPVKRVFGNVAQKAIGSFPFTDKKMGPAIEFNVFRQDTKTASGKAKYDCSDILADLGFRQLYTPSRLQPIRVLQQFIRVLRIPNGTVVAIQYPGNVDFFYRMLNRKDVSKVAIIHDLESLREVKTAQVEGEVLSMFDCVISHTPAMTDVIRAMGYEGAIVELGLFDYLLPHEEPRADHRAGVVSYAGNFMKSAFMRDLGDVPNLHFELAGLPEVPEEDLPSNAVYQGAFPADVVPFRLGGSWGLVWDGVSIDTCAGKDGSYLRFNCPHKASMYIAAGLPLVVWEESAIAPYVAKEGIGICVSGLSNAAEVIADMPEADYKRILENVAREQAGIVSGAHLKSAMWQALMSIGVTG